MPGRDLPENTQHNGLPLEVLADVYEDLSSDDRNELLQCLFVAASLGPDRLWDTLDQLVFLRMVQNDLDGLGDGGLDTRDITPG